MGEETGYAFSPTFAPIAKFGEYIKLVPDNKFYRVASVEPLPTFVQDFGSLAANGKDTDRIDIVSTFLRMPEKTLAQLRMKLLDDFNLYLYQPKAKAKGTTTFITSRVDFHTQELSSNLTEFFQFEDRSAGIVRENPSATTLPKTRVLFYGFKYTLEEVTETPEKYTVVPVGER
jgi:hypothetical protein